jgi:transcriptional regulator GlxA family with amidase domain
MEGERERVSGGAANQDPELLRRLLRARDRMDAASHEAWPVRRLARVSHVSEAHFARSFKQAFGVPPHRYLLTRRIERATALLRDTDLSITEIAFQTGWSSLGTFGRTFRDITGRSPTAVRARARAAVRIGSPASPIAISGPRTGPTSPSQFRRSGAEWRVI